LSNAVCTDWVLGQKLAADLFRLGSGALRLYRLGLIVSVEWVRVKIYNMVATSKLDKSD